MKKLSIKPNILRTTYKSAGSKQRYLQITRTRTQFQFARAITIGISVGLLALMFQYFLWYGETFRVYIITLMKANSLWYFPMVVVAIAGIAAFVGWMTAKISPEAALFRTFGSQ